MPPTRRSGAAAQKKTLPSSHDEDVAFATSERANSEFETELSGAFRLLSVEGSPSKVRTSDLGKLLRAIGAGEIAEMKPLENIVDINHSGFFTREKVRRFYRSLDKGMKIFVALRIRFRRARRRRERNAVAFSSNSNVSSLTSPVSFVSGHRRLGKTQRTRAFPLVGRALRSLRLWA